MGFISRSWLHTPNCDEREYGWVVGQILLRLSHARANMKRRRRWQKKRTEFACSFVESDLMRGDATSARVYAVSRRHSIESLSKLNMHRAQARAVNRCWASSVDFWFLGTWPNIVNAPSSLNAIHFRVVLRRVWKFAWFAVIYSKSFIFVMEFERQNSLG